ncbi:hypothetical protein [Thiomonas sp. FB-Cd]|uniref:hypothetical protein n=1 Tax=Thiomonas sp. FB-Cd TaxID=1158292 RepID=UPI0004DFBA68
MTIARLDRLTLHCNILETGSERLRFRHSTAIAKTGIKAREQKLSNAGEPVHPREPESTR